MDHQCMAMLMFSIVVMSLRGGGAKQARACMDKKEAKKRGQFYADRRSPQSDRWESWWSQWYDNHDDHHIGHILLIFGDLPTLQMITYCCETGNRKQGWGWGGLGHKSSGRGKILRQQDNRIRMTDSKYLGIIKTEGVGGVGPRSRTLWKHLSFTLR